MKSENAPNLTEFEKECEQSLKAILKRSRQRFAAITKQYEFLCKELADMKKILLATNAKIRSR